MFKCKPREGLSLTLHQPYGLFPGKLMRPADGEGFFRNEPACMVYENPGTDRLCEPETGLEDGKLKGEVVGIHEIERVGTVDAVNEIKIFQNMLYLSEPPTIQQPVLDRIHSMNRNLHGSQPKGSVDLQIVSKSSQISVDSNLINLTSNFVQLKNLLLTIGL
jgi:hypothetical protein